MRGTFRITLAKALVTLVVLMTGAMAAHASVPVTLEYGRGRSKMIQLMMEAQKQLDNGDLEAARRSLDAVIQADPSLYPAYYLQAKGFLYQHKY